MSFYDERDDLYDIAFSWNIAEEVDWLLARLGPGCKTILEPACGSGRMFPAFAERCVEVVGVELSHTMIRRARERMAGLSLPAPRILHGDMTDFDMGATFDGAICPINSFGYLLSSDAAHSHLTSMARHLGPGCRFLVQMDLADYQTPTTCTPGAYTWETECDGVRVRTQWYERSFDSDSKLETQICRFEVLTGPDAGRVTEDEHIVRRWNVADWAGLIEETPFVLAACYDGNSNERDPLPLKNHDLIWHELVLS